MINTISFIARNGTKEKIKQTELLLLTMNQLISKEIFLSININGRVFFEDDYFCIYEFSKAIYSWKQNGCVSDMAYHSIETDDNPLLLFSYKEGGFTIISPWQNFDASSIIIESTDFCTAVSNFVSQFVENDQ